MKAEAGEYEDALKYLVSENERLKKIGCEGSDGDLVLRENQGLKALVKYCVQLRDLDKNKEAVSKETRKIIEDKVNNLIKK